jgi:hypothetical protein
VLPHPRQHQLLHQLLKLLRRHQLLRLLLLLHLHLLHLLLLLQQVPELLSRCQLSARVFQKEQLLAG